MKETFQRTDDLFSLCGLNCGLCPMHVRGECGGCFSDSPCYPGCPIAPCSVAHGGVDYCFQCDSYPCKRYDTIDLYDSLISHRNQKKDLAKAKAMGIGAYLDEQRAKQEILHRLLNDYDDGRRDVFFCLAVNMLDLADLKQVLSEADRTSAGFSRTDKAGHVSSLLQRCAVSRNIPLKLRH